MADAGRERPQLAMRRRAWIRRGLALLLSLGALLTLSAATAAATCQFDAYVPSAGYGATNPAEKNIERCFAADPINCATGNLTETQVDLAVLGHGPPLRAVRTYNSQLAATQGSAGAFGFGWTGPYSAHLTFANEKTEVTVHHDNGSTATFQLEGGQYVASAWVESSLVKSGETYVYTLPHQMKLKFNGSGRLLEIIDRHNLALTMSYDANGRLEAVADSASRKLTFAYTASGQVESITDPMSRTVKYGYSSGDLASVTLPGDTSPRWEFGYNGFHELTSLTNGRGYTTTTTYDSAHRATSQTDPLKRKYTFVYGETNGIDETTITEPNGAVTIEKFNEAGEPTSVTHAAATAIASTSTYTYDSSYRLASATDPNGHTTTWTYDERGNRLSEKDPNGNETQWTYNSANDVISVTDPKGQTTTITRNAAGDPTIIERTIGASTQELKFSYNEFGDLISRTDPEGRSRIYVYSASDGIPSEEYVEAVNGENLLRSWAHNANGETTQEVDGRGYEPGNEPSSFTSKITLDAQGRPASTTDPLGHSIEVTYDDNGNPSTATDENGHVTTYVYDAADQLTEVVGAHGVSTKTAYDALGNVISRTDGKGEVREYKRDLLGRVTEAVDPLGRKTVNEYDLAGNLVKVTDPEGRSTTYSYDPGNRPVEVDYSSSGTVDVGYAYDKKGNLVEITDGTGTTKRTYDALDHLVEVKNGKEESVKYDYNLADDVTEIVYPNGKAITRKFDKLGRMEKVVDWLGKETKFNYYRNSQLRSTVFPAETGNADEYTYNARGDLTKISVMKGAEVLASASYVRDKVGQVKSRTQKGLPGNENLSYEYDAGDRLVKEGGVPYEYDAANNPTKISQGLYAYDKASQLESGPEATFSYSKLGERLKRTPTTGPATSYTYDQAGNLVSVQRPAEGATPKINETYKYDGSGLRVSESVDGVSYPMVWDLTSELPLLLTDGRNSYVYGPEGLAIEQINSKEEPHFLHHDQQGSTRLLTGSSGKVEGAYHYKAFGSVEGHTGTVTTRLGYGGQYRSPSGLIYLRSRVYDPATAQFLTVDPLVQQTGEPYGYAESNPMNLADPSGLAVKGICGGGTLSLPFGQGSGLFCRVWNDKGEGAWMFTLGGTFGQNADGLKLEKWIQQQTFGSLLKLFGKTFYGGGYYLTSNAGAWSDLEEWSDVLVSGSIAMVLGLSYEYSRSVSNPNVYTHVAGPGVGAGASLSVTGGKSYSWVWPDEPVKPAPPGVKCRPR